MPTPTLSPLQRLHASHQQRTAQQTIRSGQVPQLEANVRTTEATHTNHFNTIYTPAKNLHDSTKAVVDAKRQQISTFLDSLRTNINVPLILDALDQFKSALTTTTDPNVIQQIINDLTAPVAPVTTAPTPAQPSAFYSRFRAGVPVTVMDDAQFAVGEQVLKGLVTELQTDLAPHIPTLEPYTRISAEEAAHRRLKDGAIRARDALQTAIQAEQVSLAELARDIPDIQQRVTDALGDVNTYNVAHGATFDPTHAQPIIEHCFIAAHYMTKKSHGHAHRETAAVLNHAYTRDGLSYDILTTVPDASGTAAAGTTGIPTATIISAPTATGGTAGTGALPAPRHTTGAAAGGTTGTATTREFKTKLELINAFSEDNKDTRARLTGHKQDDAVIHSFRVLAEKFNHRIEMDNKGNRHEAMRFMAIAEHLRKTDPTMAKLKVGVSRFRTPIQLIYNLWHRDEYNDMVKNLAEGKSATAKRATTLRAAPAAAAPTT